MNAIAANASRTDRMGRRSAWLAAFLSLILPGLGHLYIGNPRSACALFVATALSFALTAVWQIGLPDRFWMLAASKAVVTLVYLYAIIDAVVQARSRKIVVVRRIVAVAGERIAVIGGRAVVNGVALNEPYAKIAKLGASSLELPEMIVPAGTVFVLADNRNEAEDNQFTFHGPVPIANLVGRATDIGFSTDFYRMGLWIGTVS